MRKIIRSFENEVYYEETQPLGYERIELKSKETLVLLWDIDSEVIDLEVIEAFTQSIGKIYPDNKVISVPKELVAFKVITNN